MRIKLHKRNSTKVNTNSESVIQKIIFLKTTNYFESKCGLCSICVDAYLNDLLWLIVSAW